ncbi:Mobile element protein [Enhygromyxa salina]|uniref:Mobile element protein n=1 Tax=Enhygromyxa salina TaxID=215803 RepID=A0A0C2CZL6_9BACT|nr:helix-turn-helix domain-containing protein [Enhygromyxa salina]KIG15065.1 Mobile element protein [Enhygromyxa salina]
MCANAPGAQPDRLMQNTRRTKRTVNLTPQQRLELMRLSSPETRDEAVRVRAHIILSWAAGATGAQSAALLETSRRTISKWRARFDEGGVDALWDRPRPGAPPTISEGKVTELLRLRQSPPPVGAPRWTTRMLAKRTGLSQSTVVRIAAKLRDHSEHAAML